MAVLPTLPLKHGVQTKLYDASHPEMGEGLVIEVVDERKGKDPAPGSASSVRFFPTDIKEGALYSGQLSYGDGTNVATFAELWELEDVEPCEDTESRSVNDFNEFHPWDWNTSVIEEDDDNAGHYRISVAIKHTETRGRRVLVKTTAWSYTTDWYKIENYTPWKLKAIFLKEFFTMFQGCKMVMKNTNS